MQMYSRSRYLTTIRVPFFFLCTFIKTKACRSLLFRLINLKYLRLLAENTI